MVHMGALSEFTHLRTDENASLRPLCTVRLPNPDLVKQWPVFLQSRFPFRIEEDDALLLRIRTWICWGDRGLGRTRRLSRYLLVRLDIVITR